MVTTKDIEFGEEITVNYGETYFDDEAFTKKNMPSPPSQPVVQVTPLESDTSFGRSLGTFDIDRSAELDPGDPMDVDEEGGVKSEAEVPPGSNRRSSRRAKVGTGQSIGVVRHNRRPASLRKGTQVTMHRRKEVDQQKRRLRGRNGKERAGS